MAAPIRAASLPKISLFDLFLPAGRIVRTGKGATGQPAIQIRRSSRNLEPTKTEPDDPKKNEAEMEKPNEKPAASGQEEIKPAEETFTPEQDATVVKMKSENKIWREIGEAVGKQKGTVQARYKQLTAGTATAAAAPKEAVGTEVKGKQQKGGPAPQHGDQQNTAKAAIAATGGGRKGDKKHIAMADAKFTLGEWATLTEDAEFTSQQLQLLVQLVVTDAEERWDRIASRYFDATGRRVAGEDISKKFKALEM